MIYPIEIKGKTKAQVTKINLSGKGLREMPENVFDYVNLEKLNLSHNKIKVNQSQRRLRQSYNVLRQNV